MLFYPCSWSTLRGGEEREKRRHRRRRAVSASFSIINWEKMRVCARKGRLSSLISSPRRSNSLKKGYVFPSRLCEFSLYQNPSPFNISLSIQPHTYKHIHPLNIQSRDSSFMFLSVSCTQRTSIIGRRRQRPRCIYYYYNYNQISSTCYETLSLNSHTFFHTLLSHIDS